jgi:DNA-binding NtrC family response regulator
MCTPMGVHCTSESEDWDRMGLHPITTGTDEKGSNLNDGPGARPLKCCYVDRRSDFFSLLGKKLGSEFVLLPATRGSAEDREQLANCDVIIASLPASHHPSFSSSLSQLQELVHNPQVAPVVALLASPEREVMRLALANGAYDQFGENGPLDELRAILRRAARHRELMLELDRLRTSAASLSDFESVVGTDPKMREGFEFARKVAQTDTTVLITGESGTGKELMARALHQNSSRKAQPFVAVACSSLPDTLIESELFGHEKGAFTGAVTARRGRFEAAERGTIFLDEVGEMAPSLQVKLLRVLQERTFERLGSNHPRPMEARIICATNRNLKELVAAGSFRLDLYYRLNTVEIPLPPLRERRRDISLLAHTFLHTYTIRHKRPVARISHAAMCALEEHSWPGNVRELENVIERAVVICDRAEIGMQDLPQELTTNARESESTTFEEEVRDFKRRLITRALAANGNNKMRAALSLKMPRSSLHRLIGELNISELDPLEEPESAEIPDPTIQ